MGEHLAHGVSAQAEDPGGLPDAHAVYHAGSSDAQIQFHLVHPSHLPRGRVVPYGKWRTVQFSSAVYRRSSRPDRCIITPTVTESPSHAVRYIVQCSHVYDPAKRDVRPMVEQAAGPTGGEPHRRQIAGSRRWTSRRREVCWQRRVRDENPVWSWIPGLLYHARR